MNALRPRPATGRILLEVRQLEQQLARTRDSATIDKLLDRIDRLTAQGMRAERRSKIGRTVEMGLHRPGRRSPCLRLIKG